ncbi:MAG: hypothetical protein Q8O00_09365 [Holophaga sp.]|nr:hypothetical protein [Holophaga sp.]
MFNPLQQFLAREQWAFLARDRREWGIHLTHIREFLGEGLERADPKRPVLILGAGSGLEIPWRQAPPKTIGWDADPSSRIRTLLRHGRLAPWNYGDITGGFASLQSAAQRCVKESWSGRRRPVEIARLRLAAILPTLPANPVALRQWIQHHRPGSILAANFMGQLAPLAQDILELSFAPHWPWEKDPESNDPLGEALERWTERQVDSLLKELAESGAELWLVHDRAVMEANPTLRLGPFTPDWRLQLKGTDHLEAWDPLCRVDVLAALKNHPLLHQSRWLWPLGPGQLHLTEALAFGTKLS